MGAALRAAMLVASLGVGAAGCLGTLSGGDDAAGAAEAGPPSDSSPTADATGDGGGPSTDTFAADASATRDATRDAARGDVGIGGDASVDQSLAADGSVDQSAVGCPASKAVRLSQWTGSPWTAPSSGTAQQAFIVSKEKGRHYARATLELDVEVTNVPSPYVCFVELRTVGGSKSPTYPWRYFAICTKQSSPRKLVFIVFAADDGYQTKTFSLKANTKYHVSVDFDAAASSASLSLREIGGATTTIVKSPLTSSIVPQGQGLQLLVGFSATHPDYPTIKPPWGWRFSNLDVRLTPGGPYGAKAPPCP